MPATTSASLAVGPKPAPRRKAPNRAKAAKPDAHVVAKRLHRLQLSERAEAHWKLEGARARHAYLERIRSALEREGFRSTPFQWRHKGHEYGLVKDLGDKQIHVRVYQNGVIDAEVEIHKRYLQHLWSPRPSAHRQVQAIFRKYGIPVKFVNEKYIPQVGPDRRHFPKARTKVSHLLAGAGGALGIVGIYAARLVLQRVKRV